MVAGKKIRSKIDYDCTASSGRLKNPDSIYREGISIYTGAFRKSLVESLHIEAYDPSRELKMSELGLKFIYKRKIKITYTVSLTPWMIERIKTMKK